MNYTWNEKTILIVEDVETNNMFFQAALGKTGAKLIWANDGSKAVELVKNNTKIDIILMDMRMPNLDGFEATKQIKAFKKEIPIVAQTTYVLDDEKRRIFEAGCDEYLAKPIRFDTLLKTIDRYFKALE